MANAGILTDEQLMRLNRRSWGNPQVNMLAQELYAMFTAPAQAETPVNLPPNSTVADVPFQLTPVTEPTVNINPQGTPKNYPRLGWGIVGAKVSTNVYNVTVYFGDPATFPAAGTYKATQRQIDAQEVIPPGTECMCFCILDASGNITNVLMQVPIYLEIP